MLTRHISEQVQQLVHSPALWSVAIVQDLGSLGRGALPHELKAALGAAFLLAHVTLVPERELEEAGEHLGSDSSAKELVEQCILHVDPHAKVRVTVCVCVCVCVCMYVCVCN
jgi:hypothetical protein